VSHPGGVLADLAPTERALGARRSLVRSLVILHLRLTLNIIVIIAILCRTRNKRQHQQRRRQQPTVQA